MIGQISPPSSNEHRYTLVAVDHFTKCVEVIPLRNVDQGNIINFIEQNIIFRLGIPETLTTNQGTIFTGRKVVNMPILEISSY